MINGEHSMTFETFEKVETFDCGTCIRPCYACHVILPSSLYDTAPSNALKTTFCPPPPWKIHPVNWLTDWLIFNKTRIKRTCKIVKLRSEMEVQYKNTNIIQETNTSYIYRKRQRGTNDFLYSSESHLGSSYVCLCCYGDTRRLIIYI